MSETDVQPGSTTPDTTRDGLPDWAAKEIRELRDEAAGRRVDNKNLNEQLTSVSGQVQTITTEKDEAVSRATAAETSLLKLTVALSVGVPGEQAAEFAELLQGSTEQELRDYAEKIRKFNGGPVRPGYDPSQGRGAEDNTPLTPEQEFLALLKGKGLA